jgi:hypothetical protein
MTIEWGANAAFVGELFVFVLFWISCWSLLELTTDKYISEYWKKMVLFSIILVVSIIIMLIFADKFNKSV